MMNEEKRRYNLWVALCLALLCFGIGVGISYLVLGMASSPNPPQEELSTIVPPQPEVQNKVEETAKTEASMDMNTEERLAPSRKRKVGKRPKTPMPPSEPSERRPTDSQIELPF